MVKLSIAPLLHRLFIVLFACLLVVPGIVVSRTMPAIADSCATPPTKIAPPSGQSTYFNEFSGLGSSAYPTRQDISDEMRDLINSADDGSTIYIAGYVLNDPTTIAALEAAADAGCRAVVVDVIMNGAASSDPQTQGLATYLNSSQAAAGSYLTYCGTNMSCLSHVTGAINHNKFMLLTSVDGSADIVFQTSENFRTDYSGDDFWNNAVVINDGSVGSTALFDSYAQYFQDMKTQASASTGLTNYWPVQSAADRTDSLASAKVYYSPDLSNDIIYNDLTHVSCANGQSTSDGKTHVRVAMSKWSNGRSNIAQELASLDAAGCNVNVIFRADAGSDVRTQLTTNKGTMDTYYFCPPTTLSTDYGVTDVHTLHSKYLLISGRYNDVDDQSIVITGSQNLTPKSLEDNDEAVLKLTDVDTFGAFQDDFSAMRLMLKGNGRTTGSSPSLCSPL